MNCFVNKHSGVTGAIHLRKTNLTSFYEVGRLVFRHKNRRVVACHFLRVHARSTRAIKQTEKETLMHLALCICRASSGFQLFKFRVLALYSESDGKPGQRIRVAVSPRSVWFVKNIPRPNSYHFPDYVMSACIRHGMPLTLRLNKYQPAVGSRADWRERSEKRQRAQFARLICCWNNINSFYEASFWAHLFYGALPPWSFHQDTLCTINTILPRLSLKYMRKFRNIFRWQV